MAEANETQQTVRKIYNIIGLIPKITTYVFIKMQNILMAFLYKSLFGKWHFNSLHVMIKKQQWACKNTALLVVYEYCDCLDPFIPEGLCGNRMWFFFLHLFVPTNRSQNKWSYWLNWLCTAENTQIHTKKISKILNFVLALNEKDQHEPILSLFLHYAESVKMVDLPLAVVRI